MFRIYLSPLIQFYILGVSRACANERRLPGVGQIAFPTEEDPRVHSVNVKA